MKAGPRAVRKLVYLIVPAFRFTGPLWGAMRTPT